jgi:Uma2 family endonuclease
MTINTLKHPANNPPVVVQPLENGDRLTRAEFEYRYEAMPQIKKAELIEGIVHMASPLRARAHCRPHAEIMTWLGTYQAATPGTDLLDNATVWLDVDNEPQPDALLRIAQGGQSQISEADYVEGAPELIVEVAASSVSIDLHTKLNVYRRNQVQEYLVWRVYDQAIDWFRLREGKYMQLVANDQGIICSQVFPGLWLAPAALLEGKLAEVLAILQQAIATAEHQAFAQPISANRPTSSIVPGISYQLGVIR